MLVITQLLNLALVPLLQHAGLALAIGLGALINALWLLLGLMRRGSYRPSPGWGMFLLRVALASALLAVFLMVAGSAFDWTAMRAHSLQRIGLMALVLLGSSALYFIALRILGMNLRQLLQR